MRRYLLLGLTLLVLFPLKAQVEKEGDFEKMKKESQDMFEQFKQQANKEFEDFRKKANDEYARFMEEAWTSYSVKDAEEIPMEPKPVIMYEHEARVTNDMIEYDVIKDVPTDRLPSQSLPLASISNEDLELVGQPEPLEPIMATFDASATMQSL